MSIAQHYINEGMSLGVTKGLNQGLNQGQREMREMLASFLEDRFPEDDWFELVSKIASTSLKQLRGQIYRFESAHSAKLWLAEHTFVQGV